MQNKDSIIYTNKKKYYLNSDEILQHYLFISDNSSECLSFILKERPKFIYIDFSKSYLPLIEYISKIQKKYSYIPTIVIADTVKIYDIIRNSPTALFPEKTGIPKNLSRQLDEILQAMNFSPCLKGYEYIKMCIFEELNQHSFNIKSIYKIVAIHCETTVYSVERGVSFAIKKAFSTVGNTKFKRYFENTEKAPTNAEFIKYMSLHIKESSSL